MPHRVDYDLQIVAFDRDRMGLFTTGGEQVVTAVRGEQQWLVHADGLEDVTVDTRLEAITVMQNHAVTVLPADGYSVMIPFGLKELP